MNRATTEFGSAQFKKYRFNRLIEKTNLSMSIFSAWPDATTSTAAFKQSLIFNSHISRLTSFDNRKACFSSLPFSILNSSILFFSRCQLDLLFNHLFSATWSNIFEENILIVSIKSLKGENKTRLKNETEITIYHFLTLLQT